MSHTEHYTHGHAESVLRGHRWRTADNSAAYLVGQLRQGQSLLDVGCGPGTLTKDLATLVAPGVVVGIDNSLEVLEAASSTHFAPNLSYMKANVYELPFDDATFDVVHAHQVLQHLADPVAALKEMTRVCRPGGIIAARDGDYGAFTWYPLEPELDEWLALYYAVTTHNEGQANGGRYLASWFHAAGLTRREVTASTWVFANDEDRMFWGSMWADRIRDSEFARRALELEFTTPQQLEEIARAFMRVATSPDGLFTVPSVEVIAWR